MAVAVTRGFATMQDVFNTMNKPSVRELERLHRPCNRFLYHCAVCMTLIHEWMPCFYCVSWLHACVRLMCPAFLASGCTLTRFVVPRCDPACLLLRVEGRCLFELLAVVGVISFSPFTFVGYHLCVRVCVVVVFRCSSTTTTRSSKTRMWFVSLLLLGCGQSGTFTIPWAHKGRGEEGEREGETEKE